MTRGTKYVLLRRAPPELLSRWIDASSRLHVWRWLACVCLSVTILYSVLPRHSIRAGIMQSLRNAGGFGPSPANSQQAQPFHSQPPTQPSDTPSPMGGESVSICPRPGHMRTVWALRVAGRLRFPSPISHALPRSMQQAPTGQGHDTQARGSLRLVTAVARSWQGRRGEG